MIAYGGHSSVEATATATEASAAFDVARVVYIINDGTADIIFNLNGPTTAPSKFTLKPAEALKDFDRGCSALSYRAATGSQPFRALGVK